MTPNTAIHAATLTSLIAAGAITGRASAALAYAYLRIMRAREQGNPHPPLPLALSHCPHCGTKRRLITRLPLIGLVCSEGASCAKCAKKVPGAHPGLELVGSALGILAFAIAPSFLETFSLAAFSWLLLASAAVDWRTGFIPRRICLGLVAVGIATTVAAAGTGHFTSLAAQISWDMERSGLGEAFATLVLHLADPMNGARLGPLPAAMALLPAMLVACCWAWMPRLWGGPADRHPYDAIGGGDVWLIGGAAFCLSPILLMPAVALAALGGRLTLAIQGKVAGSRTRMAPWIATALYAAALTGLALN